MTRRYVFRAIGPVVPALLASLVLAVSARPAAADAPKAAIVYEPGKVWQVHVTLSAEEFAAIQPRGGWGQPAPKAADPKREVHRNNFGVDLPWGVGAAAVGDQTFAQVGIRYKGNGTIGDAARTVKKSLKIDLDRAGGTGRFAGSRAINLHCEVTDPSKCREWLGYELYRAAGVPAPRTALAEVRLTVPGKYDKELLGLYTLVEEVDKPFLKDRFGSDAGLLMKPEGLREFEDKGTDWERYKKAYAPKRDATADEAKRMIAFARLVHKGDDATFNKEIGSYLDIDAYLRFLAATAFVANGDSFFVLGHNYCLYLHPKTNKLHFLPWDLDRAFANFPILGTATQQTDLSFVHPYSGTHRLTERLLAVPEVAAQYQKLLKELAGGAFGKEQVLKRLAAAEAAVKAPLERDVKAAAARKENNFNMFGRPPALKTFLEKRAASAAAQAAGTSKGFVPTGFGFGPPKMGAMMAPPMMDAMDKDRDDKLSRDELLAGVKRLFDSCTKDKDGMVDLKALTAGVKLQLPEQDAPPPGGFNFNEYMAGAILTRADSNKDGKLTAEEMATAAGEVFDKFDKNKTGKLDDEAFEEMLTSVFPVPKFAPPPKKDPPKDGKCAAGVCVVFHVEHHTREGKVDF